jgi:CRP-like cAMP-binding protein
VQVHVGQRVLGESGKGDVVGEFAVLASAPRSASVTAIEPSLLLRLRRGPLEELLDDRPEIARGVISTLVRLLQVANEDGTRTAEA